MTSIPPPTPIPMFSIVACTSNNNNNIDWNESINSIINQTYDNWELIIVFYNTEISDHITELTKKYNILDENTETNINKKIRVLYYSDKLSYSETLLRVAKHESLYDYIAIMELGDTWAPIKLEKQAKTLLDYKKIDVLGTKSVYAEVVNNNTRKVISSNPIDELYKVNIFKTNPFINSTVVLKKSILEYLKSSQSKYDLNIFWVQLAVEQYNLYNLNDVMVKNHSLSAITEYNQCYSSQEMIESINNVKSKYIRIKFFSDFCDSYTCKSHYERMCMVDEIDYYGKMKKMYITCTETYTHAIFLNCPTPSNLQVDKKHVIGFAQEPPNTPYLRLTQNNFVEYAIKNIGKYFIGSTGGLPSSTFLGNHGFLFYETPKYINDFSTKNKLMSIMVSKKMFTVGHRYRHALVQNILNQNLPIDIWGNGVELYRQQYGNNKYLKSSFKSMKEMCKDYVFTIAIENTSHDHYFTEKIINPFVYNTIPVYWGCSKVENYFPNHVIPLTGDIHIDMEAIKFILKNPQQFINRHKIDIEMVLNKVNLIKNIENLFDIK
jgi:hypothetical protein